MSAAFDPAAVRSVLVAEADLTPEDDAAIRDLLMAAFPAMRERYAGASSWGSAPDYRLLLAAGERLVGHLDLERRVIEVGSADVLVAGVGEMAVHPEVQRRGLGRRLTEELLRVLLGPVPVSFGYLNAGPADAAFYEAVGWTRIDATHRYLDPETRRWEIGDGPTFVLPAGLPASAWPPGPIDLRGTPW